MAAALARNEACEQLLENRKEEEAAARLRVCSGQGGVDIAAAAAAGAARGARGVTGWKMLKLRLESSGKGCCGCRADWRRMTVAAVLKVEKVATTGLNTAALMKAGGGGRRVGLL